jgi:hypothetical protein
MVMISPTGIINNKVPKCASFSFSVSFTTGMREVQLEYPNPEMKK